MFKDHIYRLESWLEFSGVAKTWRDVMIAEESEIYDGANLSISPGNLRMPEDYEDRFTDLLSHGFDWIHLNALGTLQDSLIVTVVWPRNGSSLEPQQVAVNFSHELPRDLSSYTSEA